MVDLTQEKESRLEKRNVVTDEEIESVLSEVLRESQVLEILSLRDNQITLANGKLTAALAAPAFQTLRELDLGDNQIGPVGAEKLIDALKKNQSLTEFRV